MTDSRSHDVADALAGLMQGDADAAGRLMPLVYEELRAIAGHYFQNQRPDQTLQPTALVHEAYVRLIDQPSARWQDRAHFMAIAATAMRQILADHARKRGTAKRGGDWQRITLDAAIAKGSAPLDVVDLHNALTELATLDARKYRVVELRFFAAMSVDEVAEILDVSKTTAESDWRTARAWLSSKLHSESSATEE